MRRKGGDGSLKCPRAHTARVRLSDSGSVGSDGRTGSRGEEEDPGVPGYHTKDALPAPHPDPLLPGTGLTRLRGAAAFHSMFSFSRLFFFQSIVQQFLVLLMSNPDESLRFLSFRLDFNEHYRSVTGNAT